MVDPLRKKLRRRPNLSSAVYEAIKEWLIRETLETGTKINENEIARRLGVSRTPVREAMHKLESEGLVEIIPRYGTFVASISTKDIQEIYDLRGALETLALDTGFEHIPRAQLLEMKRLHDNCIQPVEADDIDSFIKLDNRFHDLIISAGGNNKLIQMMANLKNQIRLSKLESLSVPGRAKQSLAEHEAIIEAMLSGNKTKAEKLLREHTQIAKTNLLRFLERRQAVYSKETRI